MSWTQGQALPADTRPAITRQQLKDYAEASGDPNPIHLDEVFAKEAGFKGVIAHGMLSMAILGDYVTQLFPAETHKLTVMKARFRKVTYPGDVLTCEGEVRKVSPDGELRLALRTRNQLLEITTESEAVFRPV